MHPISALMLSEALEQERRREVEQRRRRVFNSEPMRPNDRRRLSWLARLPRLPRLPRLAIGSMA
ncbi:MAG: hypothetical protein ACR2K4_07085 [Candidatus Limnocylindria bacterium]